MSINIDTVIRGGLVVDGTGAPGRHADVGIRDGTIISVGDVDGLNAVSIDAEGLVVIPGFVDLHTHYDAQLFWDPACSPSPLHGVTTVISGNCGFTLAPVQPGDERFLTRLLARVEGIPLEALEAGVEFCWSTYPEMLDVIEARGLGVNVGLMVGHAAVRRSVMGEAASSSAASPEQIAAMCAVLDDAVAAGGLGLSTATVATQVDGDGRPTPPSFATREEFLALARVCGQHPGTCLEFTPGSYLRGFSDDDAQLMADMSAAADRHLNWNPVLVNRADPDLWRRQLAVCDVARARGGWVVPFVGPQNGPMQHDFLGAYVFRALPGWGDVFDLPQAERTRALADPAIRDRLRASLANETAGLAVTLRDAWGRYVVNEVHDEALQPLIGRSIAELAAEHGVDPFDAILDVAVAGNLDVGFVRYPYPADDEWLRTTRAELFRDERVILGASDAGAHLDMMVGADFPTRAMRELVHDQAVFTLEEFVQRLTDSPARLFGMRDRGRVAEGYVADLVVLDPDTVGASPPHTDRDLPAHSPRLTTSATGVHHVLVGGEAVVRDGTLTGGRPGRLLRSGRDTDTVRASEQ